MDVDLILKYRPVFFRDCWSQTGAVDHARQCLAARCLPKSLILLGDYGSGKTTLARLIGRAMSCSNGTDPEPCGTCAGCVDPTLRFMGLMGAVIDIPGNRFHLDTLKRFVEADCYYPPPAAYNAHVALLDEAHRITLRDQEAMLDLIEDTPHTHFIFCTTDEDKICTGIRERSHTLHLRLPTVSEAAVALRRIAQAEGMEISDATIAKIIENRNQNPRGCLRFLQHYKATGALPQKLHSA
jgi:DNA polymerase III subunit gamma/tau